MIKPKNINENERRKIIDTIISAYKSHDEKVNQINKRIEEIELELQNEANVGRKWEKE